MRLSGHAEVMPHVDVNYYWRERVRVHVPIVTQPTVRFVCGDAQVNMRDGECWIFDTWRTHHVSQRPRAAAYPPGGRYGRRRGVLGAPAQRATVRPRTAGLVAAAASAPIARSAALDFESENLPATS